MLRVAGAFLTAALPVEVLSHPLFHTVLLHTPLPCSSTCPRTPRATARQLSEAEQASLLHADLATRAKSLGLPKGLIRTTGDAGSGAVALA